MVTTTEIPLEFWEKMRDEFTAKYGSPHYYEDLEHYVQERWAEMHQDYTPDYYTPLIERERLPYQPEGYAYQEIEQELREAKNIADTIDRQGGYDQDVAPQDVIYELVMKGYPLEQIEYIAREVFKDNPDQWERIKLSYNTIHAGDAPSNTGAYYSPSEGWKTLPPTREGERIPGEKFPLKPRGILDVVKRNAAVIAVGVIAVGALIFAAVRR